LTTGAVAVALGLAVADDVLGHGAAEAGALAVPAAPDAAADGDGDGEAQLASAD
jgi:hypothetical protein